MGFGATRVDTIFARVMCVGGGESRFDGLFVTDLVLPREIARHLVGELRCARGERALRIGDALQLAVLDFDEIGGVLRGGGAVGDDQRHGFTDETHLPVREHRALRGSRLHAVLADELHGVRRPDVPRAHRVLAGEHLLHAGKGRRILRVHRDDLGVRTVERTKWP